MSFFLRRGFSLYIQGKTIVTQEVKYLKLQPLLFWRNIQTSGILKMTEVQIEEFMALMSDDKVKNSLFVIDVREVKEIEETGIILGGVNIPLGELETALLLQPEEFKKIYKKDKPAKDMRIIFSCRSGARSLKGAMKAKELGYTNCVNNAGGWLAYEEFIKKH